MEALREFIVGAVTFLLLVLIAAVVIGGIMLILWRIVTLIRPVREERKLDDE